jgi:hypothetical protein
MLDPIYQLRGKSRPEINFARFRKLTEFAVVEKVVELYAPGLRALSRLSSTMVSPPAR